MTLNRVMAVILCYFTEFGSFWEGAITSQWLKLDPYCNTKCSPKNLIFSDA